VNNELDDILIQFDNELIEELKEAIAEPEVRTLLPVLD
jgi:anti-sigma28 factor (negative regulator of flagellin synthesis)